MAAAAAKVRRCPTAPADPEDPSQPWAKALAENMAVDLPGVHCAFAGRAWRSEDVDDVHEHVAEEHRDTVLPIAELAHPSDEEERLRVEAAYHEIVACAIRAGAPLSVYSLHRRSVEQCTKATARQNIASSIWFVCACTLPLVRDRRGNQTERGQLFKANAGNPAEVSEFGTWNMSEVRSRLSVGAYLREHRPEPGNAVFDLGDAWENGDFDGWFVSVRTPNGEVNALRCPGGRTCGACRVLGADMCRVRNRDGQSKQMASGGATDGGTSEYRN